jgi:SAM-dependent methyltransferase
MNPVRLRLASQLRGDGIEIGALHLPLAVPSRARVTYVDRMSHEDLRREHPELADQGLTPVDLVSSAEDLSQVSDRAVDFVIANHVIEHTEDPTRALKEFHRVLRGQGLLLMAVPDARVTPDQRRPITTVDHLVEEHRRGETALRVNRHLHYEDWVDNVENSAMPPGHPALTHAERTARVQSLLQRNQVIRFHVWDLTAFVEFFRAACSEEQLDFQVVEVADTLPLGGDELVILARKEPTNIQRARVRWGQRPELRSSLKTRLKASPAGPLLARAARTLRR